MLSATLSSEALPNAKLRGPMIAFSRIVVSCKRGYRSQTDERIVNMRLAIEREQI
jgi:hypothetical protein